MSSGLPSNPEDGNKDAYNIIHRIIMVLRIVQDCLYATYLRGRVTEGKGRKNKRDESRMVHGPCLIYGLVLGWPVIRWLSLNMLSWSRRSLPNGAILQF